MKQKKSQPKKNVPRPQPQKPKAPVRKSYPWLIGIALALTLIAYLPAFNAGFVNWDDDDYVVNNLQIRSFSHAGEMISHPVQGNYHPLTMLSLAFSYSMSGDKPWAYHLLNVLIHLLNTFLVYRLAWKLSRGSPVIAFACALVFGVHPMHVESVAWVSERKDVLYGCFFLLGMTQYVRYVDEGKRSHYFMSIILFLFSLASKPAAIIFPVALFTVDFLRRRPLRSSLFVEKLPYLVFGILIAWMTMTAQTTAGATDTDNVFPLASRIFFAFYGSMQYFLKFVLPMGLSAFYALPPINSALPPMYYVSPVFFIAVAVLCLMTWKKYPVITFGFAFFLINLALVLQLKVIGGAVMADRYTYIPYIGLAYILGWLLEKAFRPGHSGPFAVLITAGLVLTVVSYNQAQTWTTSVALWDNAIKHSPSDRAYIHRATFYRKAGNPDKALELYNEAIKLNKISHGAYCNRANIYFDRGQDSLAMEGYNKALEIKPDYVPALDNRGALFAREGKYDRALADLNNALHRDPTYKSAYSNRALVFYEVGKLDSCLSDCYTYLKYNPKSPDIYNSIAVCYQRMGKHDLSVDAYNKAIAISPQPIYFLYRSYSWNALGKMEEAKRDALTARQNGVQVPADYAQKLGI